MAPCNSNPNPRRKQELTYDLKRNWKIDSGELKKNETEAINENLERYDKITLYSDSALYA